MRINRTLQCDLLVVGSGLAGLRVAYDASTAGLRVILASKGRLCSGASFYPLTGALGSQLPKDDADKPFYLEELLDSGDGVADRELCKILVDEISAEIARLPELGIFTRDASGRPACFAQRERRLAIWSGWEAIRMQVASLFSRQPSLTVMPFTEIQRLVVRDGCVAGALMVDSLSEFVLVDTPTVLLATGGYCGLYRHSLNTDDVCGMGHSIALDAGTSLINLEFMQFIPGLTAPVYKLLFGEISLWHCKDVVDHRGEQVLRNSLPPEVPFETCIRERSMHGPFTTRDDSRFFELAMMQQCRTRRSPTGFTIHYLPSIATDPNQLVDHVRRMYQERGIDLATQSISVAPFAHCANGGIWIDADGATTVPGLFSAGEAAGGIHGADRHGGTATAACLVFGSRAARAAITYVGRNSRPGVSEAEVMADFVKWIDNQACSAVTATDVLQQLGESLWYDANVIRTGNVLAETLAWVRHMRGVYNPARAIEAGEDIKQSLKAFHALRLAEALLLAMIHRTESRGPHYRTDYPQRDPALTGARVVVSEKLGQMTVRYVRSDSQ